MHMYLYIQVSELLYSPVPMSPSTDTTPVTTATEGADLMRFTPSGKIRCLFMEQIVDNKL